MSDPEETALSDNPDPSHRSDSPGPGPPPNSPGDSDFQNSPVTSRPASARANPRTSLDTPGDSDLETSPIASLSASKPEGDRPADPGASPFQDSPEGSDFQEHRVVSQTTSSLEGSLSNLQISAPPNSPVVNQPTDNPEGSPTTQPVVDLESSPAGTASQTSPVAKPEEDHSQTVVDEAEPVDNPDVDRPTTSQVSPTSPVSSPENKPTNLETSPTSSEPPSCVYFTPFESYTYDRCHKQGGSPPLKSLSGKELHKGGGSPPLPGAGPGHTALQRPPVIKRSASHPGSTRPRYQGSNRFTFGPRPNRPPGSPEFVRSVHGAGHSRPYPLIPHPIIPHHHPAGPFGRHPTTSRPFPGPHHPNAPRPTLGLGRYTGAEEPISDHKRLQSKPVPKKETLKELKARKKKEMAEAASNPIPKEEKKEALKDPYGNSTAANYITKGKTGVVYDGEVLRHKCEWDDRHPENPVRLTCVMDKCYEKGFLARCYNVPNYLRTDIYEKILLVHAEELFEKLKEICQLENLNAMELEAAGYDSIYFNRYTFDAACRSLSSVLNLVFAVARAEVMNGMAFVRPPGHHAMAGEFNGYCFFNNVAIAAEACIQDKLATRILIVDIDVHHGQGIQQHFYDRKDVLYFSIHRYEHGTFWPNLMESNFNYIGEGDGLGYNVNVPLNAIGLTDEDYLAIMFSILLPIGYEFNPDLVIVSAGYDAALGCPEGKMNVTPGFYSHLIAHLSGLARGQVAVCLEGGYFPPTLSEGAAMTLKTLLGGPCPPLGPIRCVHPSVIETICNVRRALLNRWKCFSFCETFTPTEIPPKGDEHQFNICFFGKSEVAPFLTRRCYPENTEHQNIYYSRLNKALREKYRASMNLPVHYVYDEKMMLHAPKTGDVERPERGERLKSIHKVFEEYGIDKRAHRIQINKRDFTPYNPHDPQYFKAIDQDLQQSKDVYVNEFTRDCVMNAVSSLMTLCDTVMGGSAGSGVAIIRPPGHHAEHNKPMGFCFVNNVAICANYLHQKYSMNRILIVDFDVHHGNGTQNMFYQDKHVMYISIHRHDDGKYFPPNSHRDYMHDGHGIGQGYNINIPFNKDKMGDTEYIAVFHNIILPAAYSYDPEIIIVSAGFDAGINDPLGGYHVNPETFGHFIQMLKPLAEGKIILSLEGGYNLTTLGYAMGICTKVLLGDPVMMPKNLWENFSEEAGKTIRNVTEHLQKYYNIFKINKKLSLTPVMCRQLKNFTEDSYNVELYRALDPERFEDSEYVEEQLRIFNDAREE